MIIEKEISDCVESLTAGLIKTSRWRERLAVQYSADTRNAKAAKMLAKLADETPMLSGEYWQLLKPHFQSDPVRWRNALSQATRQVSFLRQKVSFPYFVRSLIGIIAVAERRSVMAATIVPGSLLSQYKLLQAVIDTPWATRLDHKIISHIIDRYYGKYEVARASLRYLQTATGATRSNIIDSVRRITGHGVMKVSLQGSGTRPTEYGLNFEFGSSGPVGDTATSGTIGDTSTGPVGNTSSASSGIVDGTESYLLNGLTSPLKVSRIEDTPAVPTAPPVPGVNADTAASAVDPGSKKSGFEELWAVFPRKHHRSKAQAAYKALAPDAALHATLVDKATQWAAHYQQTATEKKWWKHLHTWLIEERYLEDLPEPYQNPKDAAIARKRENGPRKTSKQDTVGKSGLSPKTPIGRHRVKIVSAELEGSTGWGTESQLIFTYRIEDGKYEGQEFSHAFATLSSDEAEQSDGQSIYASLRNATGMIEPGDTSDFHGKPLRAIVGSMGRIEYAAL